MVFLCEPVCAQHGHGDGVDALPVEDECGAAAPFDDEPGALVYMLGARIEGIDLQLDAVQVRGGKGVRQEQSRRLGAQASITAARTDEDAEVAGLVLGLPIPTYFT
jgi:hypothetical protein